MSERVILITGASSGFGLDAAVRLAKRGCRVFAGVRSEMACGKVHKTARENNITLTALLLDVTEPQQIQSGITQVLEKAGRLDVLVNNAGFVISGFFEDISDAELRQQLETNFFGLAAITRAVLPVMRSQRSGRIINISSAQGRRGAPLNSAYSASKFAVEGLSECIRAEVGLWGVDVVLIEPGGYNTGIIKKIKRPARADDPESVYYSASQHLRQLARSYETFGGDPSEIGTLIARIALMGGRPRLRYAKGPGVFTQLVLPKIAFEMTNNRMMRKLFALHRP